MPPTLFNKGALLPSNSTEKKEELDKHVPIEYILNRIDSLLLDVKGPEDKVLILKSGTGSGKSTAFPAKLYEKYKNHPLLGNKNIICLQPRTLTASDIPKEIINEPAYKDLNFEMGKNVGFQTGELQKKPQKSGIVYATVGVLYQQMMVMTDEDLMNKYGIVIVDECHVRSVDLDLLLLLLKKFIARNFNSNNCFTVVCMSATFDLEGYAKYFFNTSNIIIVDGQTFPVEIKFLDYDTEDYILSCTSQLVELHKTHYDERFMDFIIFISGERQGKMIKDSVEAIIKDESILVIPYSSEKNKENGIEAYHLRTDLKELNKKYKKNYKRKLFIATNIAETGLTLPNLYAVFDLMFVTTNENIPIMNANILINNKPITLSMSKQRKGRAGRKAPGVYYPMCCEKTYNMLLENQYPDIYTGDFTLHLLKILNKVDNFSIMDLDLLSKPSSDSYYSAVDNLMKLDFIDDELRPLPMGKLAAKIRYLEPENIRMIFAAYEENVFALELITIAAFMETKDWDNYKSYEFIKNKVKHNHKVDEIEYFNLNGAGKINEKQNSNLSGGYGDQNKTNKQNSNLSGGYDKLSDTIWGFNEEPSWDNFYFDNYEDKIIKINDNNIEGIYGGDEKSHLINKIILGCDFIETIFIYESFIKNLERYDIEYWCYKNKLNYKQMLNVIAKRDEIIESLASCNFKINYNAPRLNHTLSDENLNYIQRIKNCIKAGYKNHTATWNVDKNNYIDDNKKINIKIIDNELIKYNPKHIVFNKKMYFAQEINKGIKQYSLMAKKICII